MEYSKLEYYLSKPRLERFLKATMNSQAKAKKLYVVNLKVSQAFYPVLNLFEIFLRNTIDHHISNHFQDPNWIMSEKTGFMSDPTLAPSKYFLKKSVQKAENSIKRKGNAVTPGKLIAEQSLGFWTSIFETHHYRLIKGAPIQGFPNKPEKANRNLINKKLNKIRQFRNRIYHNEPICFNNFNIDFSKAQDIKNDVYDILNWIDIDLANYVEYFDDIQSRIEAAKKNNHKRA